MRGNVYSWGKSVLQGGGCILGLSGKCQTSMVAVSVTTVNPWWMLLIFGHWIVHSSDNVSTSALFDPLITEKYECFSLDLAAMLLLLAPCSNSVAWSRLARAALVQTDKRPVKHIITAPAFWSVSLQYLLFLWKPNLLIVREPCVKSQMALKLLYDLPYVWTKEIKVNYLYHIELHSIIFLQCVESKSNRTGS